MVCIRLVRFHIIQYMYFQYKGHFPLHDAASENDVEAVDILSTRKDVNALNQVGAGGVISSVGIYSFEN